MKRLSATVSEQEYRRVERLARAGTGRSVAALVREAVRRYSEELGASRLIVFREVSRPQAKREVVAYLQRKAGVVWPDEMAEELGIDYRLVLDIVGELTREGKVELANAKPEVVAR